jgi:hypothetical protein
MSSTLFAAVIVSAVLPSHGCRAPRPLGPTVQAAIIVRTSCGGFELGPTGRVTRLPSDWLARRTGGTGRHYGADISVRRTHAGRFILLRDNSVIWRSSAVYYQTGDAVAFGPHLFAFNDYYHGVFLTDLRSPERLLLRGRGLDPIGFTRSGELLISVPGRSIVVVSSDGRLLRRYSYRRSNAFTWDDRTDTLYFVRPGGMLAAAHGAQLRLIRHLTGVKGGISFTPPGLLVFYGRRSFAITNLDGRLIAQARWPRSRLENFDSGLSVSSDGRSFAFRLSSARPGAKRGHAVVYVLHAGQSRARAIYRHELGPSGCAVGASMGWHGPFLLYSSADGQRAVVDTRTGRRISLRPLLRRIPQRGRSQVEDVYWRGDFGRR